MPAAGALRAVPNPGTAGQALRFDLPLGATVRLEVVDVAGRIVRVLSPGSLVAGPHSVEWDGKSDSGARVAPGIYFVRLNAGPLRATTKVPRIS